MVGTYDTGSQEVLAKYMRLSKTPSPGSLHNSVGEDISQYTPTQRPNLPHGWQTFSTVEPQRRNKIQERGKKVRRQLLYEDPPTPPDIEQPEPLETMFTDSNELENDEW